ncbi:hypothetical protein [Microbispora sp. NPDC049125]|uniref:hypothetical protein n=1 Tax=Microbispora sp. NPDC049125 TaxID=3154929 RepID=UPI0034675970
MSDEELLVAGAERGRAPWKAVAAVCAVVLLAAAAWGVPRVLRETPRGPLAPPSGPWPTTGTFTVGVDWATVQEREAVMAALKARPDVRDVSFQSAEREWAKDKESAKLIWIRGHEWPYPYTQHLTNDSVIGTLLDRSKSADLDADIGAMPGVQGVYPLGDGFWYGKADVTLRLCPEKPDDEHGCRAPLTAAQRDAIVSAIRDTSEVEVFYFEDPAHATRDLRSQTARDLTSKVSFYQLKLKEPGDLAAVIDRFRGMDGLWQVRPVARCLLC